MPFGLNFWRWPRTQAYSWPTRLKIIRVNRGTDRNTEQNSHSFHLSGELRSGASSSSSPPSSSLSSAERRRGGARGAIGSCKKKKNNYFAIPPGSRLTAVGVRVEPPGLVTALAASVDLASGLATGLATSILVFFQLPPARRPHPAHEPPLDLRGMSVRALWNFFSIYILFSCVGFFPVVFSFLDRAVNGHAREHRRCLVSRHTTIEPQT